MNRETLAARLRDLGGRKVGWASRDTETLQRRLRELELRFGEYDHRVQNHTQMMLGILVSASHATSNLEARSVLNAVTRKLEAIMHVQTILQRAGNARSVRCDDLMRELAKGIQVASPHRFALMLDLEPSELPSSAAVPLGLILNELLTNAIKHGIGPNQGRVSVKLKRHSDLLELRVEDNGPGIDPSVLQTRSSGLGLVQHLATQLHGRFHTQPGPGGQCIVRVPQAGPATLIG